MIVCPICKRRRAAPAPGVRVQCSDGHAAAEMLPANWRASFTPNRSTAHVVELHRRIREFLIATMPLESPDSIACALMYEIVSITATMAETKDQARALLDEWLPIARQQLEQYGIGRPHP